MFCSWERANVLTLSFLFMLLSTVSFVEAEDVGEQLEQFTGGHTRLVWVQDQVDGDDALAQKNNMRVMAYDSRDGKGVRAMTKKLDNFYKPIFTPDGETVLVSIRNKHIIYTINFKTGKMKKFAKGVAIAVWLDPASGKLWVYALDGDGPEDFKLSHKALVRYRFDKPRKKEVVWDKTPMSWSNLDVSDDGKLIGGLFPWPYGSVLDTKKSELKQIGKGCWTSLSPGNDKILWIFDGAHRNLSFTDTLSGKTWKTNINGAPGIDGYEVYHPRWSNHFNFFTFTGPYKEGEGGNKIGGGGKAVEIYLGRLDNSLTTVVDWFQLTNNQKADFYPELWIEGGEASYQNYNKPEPVEAVTAEGQEASWPAGIGKLLYFWQDVFEANQLAETSLVGFSQNGTEPSGQAVFNRFGEMDLNKDGFDATYKENEALKIIKDENYFGMELLYSPAKDRSASGMIFSYGGQDGHRLAVKEAAKDLVLLVPGHTPITVEGALSSSQSSYQLYFEIDKKSIQLYIDGRPVVEEQVSAMPLKGVDSGKLVFGSNEGSQGGVDGAISHVALYGKKQGDEVRAINAAAVKQKLMARSQVEAVELEAELVEKSAIPSPDSLGAYSRALTVNRYRVVDVRAGQYGEDQIVVASWAVLDRKLVEEAGFAKEGDIVKMRVEPFDSHPELEGERLMMDMFEPDLDLYYRVEK